MRSASFDAWEVTKTRRTVKITDEEIAKGKVAKTALEGLLKSGEVFVAPTSSKGSRDSYGRLLGNLFIKTKDGTIDVQQWMKEHGHERG